MKLLHWDFPLDETNKSQFEARLRGLMSHPTDIGVYLLDQYDEIISYANSQVGKLQNTSWTIDFWFYHNSMPGSYTSYFFYSRWTTSSNNYHNLYWDHNSNRIQYYVYNGSWGGTYLNNSGPATPMLGGWNHIGIEYDRDTREYSMYLNGSRIANAIIAQTPPAGMQQFAIGNNIDSSACPSSYPFPNLMGPFRISQIARWEGALTYTMPPRPMVTDEHTVFLANFQAQDKAGRHYTATSNYTTDSQPRFVPVGKPGFGGCVHFSYDNGRAEMHTFGSSDFLFSGPFTVEMWCLVLDGGRNQWIWALNEYDLGLRYNTSNNFLAYLGDVGTSIEASDVDAFPGRWNHVVVTRNADDLCRIAVNGVFSANTQTVSGDIGSSGTGFCLGARYPDDGSETGTFCAHDVVVWNEVRYTEDFTPPAEPIA